MVADVEYLLQGVHIIAEVGGEVYRNRTRGRKAGGKQLTRFFFRSMRFDWMLAWMNERRNSCSSNQSLPSCWESVGWRKKKKHKKGRVSMREGEKRVRKEEKTGGCNWH